MIIVSFAPFCQIKTGLTVLQFLLTLKILCKFTLIIKGEGTSVFSFVTIKKRLKTLLKRISNANLIGGEDRI